MTPRPHYFVSKLMGGWRVMCRTEQIGGRTSNGEVRTVYEPVQTFMGPQGEFNARKCAEQLNREGSITFAGKTGSGATESTVDNASGNPGRRVAPGALLSKDD